MDMDEDNDAAGAGIDDEEECINFLENNQLSVVTGPLSPPQNAIMNKCTARLGDSAL